MGLVKASSVKRCSPLAVSISAHCFPISMGPKRGNHDAGAALQSSRRLKAPTPQHALYYRLTPTCSSMNVMMRM